MAENSLVSRPKRVAMRVKNIETVTTRDVSVFVKCDNLYIVFGNYHKFELLTSQGSAATHCRYGGKYYMSVVGNLLVFPAVKGF